MHSNDLLRRLNRGVRIGDVEEFHTLSSVQPRPNAKDPLEWARPPSPAMNEDEDPTPHARYYIEDESVVFQVENKLFKVHRYFLRRDSAIFRDMFSFKPAPGSKDGLDDAHPILLHDVTIKEMEALLNHFYHGMDNKRTPSLDEWLALLSITHRFQFEELCTRATSAVDKYDPPLDPVQKVLLGQRLGIRQLVVSGYVHICRRKSAMSADEGEQLGGRTTALLGQARERARTEMNKQAHGFHYTSGDPNRYEETILQKIVEEMVEL